MLAAMRVISGGLFALVFLTSANAMAQDTAPPPAGPTPVIITVTPAPSTAPASSAIAYNPPGSSPPVVYTPDGSAEPRRRGGGRRWELLGPGIALFAGGWLLTWIATSVWYGETTSCTSTGWFGYSCVHYGPDDAALAFSFIPLVGPWLMLASDSIHDAAIIPPVLFGLTQLTGLVLLILGVALPGDDEPVDPYALRFDVVPLPGGGLLSASGTF